VPHRTPARAGGGPGQLRVRFLVCGSLAVSSAAFWQAVQNSSAVTRPAASPPKAVSILGRIGEYQTKVNLDAPSFDSMIRRYSWPPGMFLALAGTMNASAALTPGGLERQLGAVHQGVGATVVAKSLGATFFCSFSSHEPEGMRAALPSFQRVCDWMWSRPSVLWSM
jgi:hypothetical protein